MDPLCGCRDHAEGAVHGAVIPVLVSRHDEKPGWVSVFCGDLEHSYSIPGNETDLDPIFEGAYEAVRGTVDVVDTGKDVNLANS